MKSKQKSHKHTGMDTDKGTNVKEKGGETPANTAPPPTRYPTMWNFSYFKHLHQQR